MKNNIRLGIGLVGLGFLALVSWRGLRRLFRRVFSPGTMRSPGAASDQTAPVIAAGGTNDARGLVGTSWSYLAGAPFYEFETAHAHHGMRRDVSVVPIDTVPFVITQEAASQAYPRLSWKTARTACSVREHDLSGTGFYYHRSRSGARFVDRKRRMRPRSRSVVFLQSAWPGPRPATAVSTGPRVPIE